MIRHKLRIQNHTGHTEIKFRPNSSRQVALAMARFNEIVAEHKGTRVAEKGPNGTSTIRQDGTFNPNAEETLLLWPLQGG